MKKVLIIANGSIHQDLLSIRVHHYDVVICADGGARIALENHLIPDLVIGDLDSLEPRYQDILRREGILMDIHPVHKDATDLELALQKAAAGKPSSITIIGGWGTRWDHSLINLHLLAAFTAKGMAVKMLNESNTARAAVPGREVRIQGCEGDCVSLVPLTPTVKGVQTEGLAYALSSQDLYFGSSLPVSNRLTGGEGAVSITEGILLVLHHYDKFAVNVDF